MNRAAFVFLFFLTLASLPGQSGEPIIPSVANAASMHRQTWGTNLPWLGVAGGTIIAIFGENLARSTVAAEGFPLPTRLGETSVLIGGALAPLFFVSPGQINAQVPSALTVLSDRKGDFYTAPVSVRVGEVQMRGHFPLRILAWGGGIFTADGSGCGQGLIYQTGPDGAVWLNSPDNSADPGKSVITVYGTGASLRGDLSTGRIPWPDGVPWPPAGHLGSEVGEVVFAETFRSIGGLSEFDSGRVEGMVGVDFTRLRLPETVPEGCAVPVRWVWGPYMSQNVTMSVRRGGGRCVVPPVESIAVLSWERSVISGRAPETVSEQLRVEFLAAPGKQLPLRDPIQYGELWGADQRETWVEHEGPSCAQPADTRLDGGEIVARGPGWGPLRARPDKDNVYQLPLPPGSIREGTFVVSGGGGKDVGAFETSVRIAAPIRPESYPPGTKIPCCSSVGVPRFRWEGGDGGSWVRVGVLSRPERLGRRGHTLWEKDAPASERTLSFHVLPSYGLPEAEEAELSFTQEARGEPVQFQAPGLTRNGLHRWVYRWRYTGLSVYGGGPP